MLQGTTAQAAVAERRKFADPDLTANGERRARVTLGRLETLWFNTGTLCNIACVNCYIDSGPTSDRLAYITLDEVRAYLDEIARLRLPVAEIGFTGGEPFMNPHFPDMLEESLARGFRALVLTNAMKPMLNKRARLLAIQRVYGTGLVLRVSIDHYRKEKHESVRGPRSWAPMIEGLGWLAAEGFNLAAAGRTLWDESEDELRAGYADLFRRLEIPVDADDASALVLFPEMDVLADVPEITERCWGLLGVAPDSVMCASSRMVVKRKGAAHPTVVACTLIPDDPQFEMGRDLAGGGRTVKLNHPHCAKFCVLGGASCSAH